MKDQTTTLGWDSFLPQRQMIIFIPLIWISYTFPTMLCAQNYEWEIHRIERREREQKRISDSLVNFLEDKWEIKVAFGSKSFSNKAKSTENEAFFFPKSMRVWQLGTVWHISERFLVDFFVGFQLSREVPTPDVFSVLNGEDFAIEGSLGLLIPIELGVKYYLMENRLRPNIGMGIGSVLARSQYIIAEGNISTGIERTDVESQDRVGLGKFTMGLDYRLGKQINSGLSFSYYISGKFEEPIGGYTSYEGFAFHMGLSLVLLNTP